VTAILPDSRATDRDTGPRPPRLPPCPEWCSEDHQGASRPGTTPRRGPCTTPAWALLHYRRVVVGRAEARITQHVDVAPDGSILDECPVQVDWDRGEGETPTHTAEMAAALLSVSLLLGELPRR
jgi:hypothetical protein